MLSIEWDNLQFYPNFALFTTLGGGVKLYHDFFHITKSTEDQKKRLHRNLMSFWPRNQVKTKK